jgi:hypothetical protein
MFPDGSSILTVIVERVTKLTPYFMLHVVSRAPRLLVANIIFLVLLAAMNFHWFCNTQGTDVTPED